MPEWLTTLIETLIEENLYRVKWAKDPEGGRFVLYVQQDLYSNAHLSKDILENIFRVVRANDVRTTREEIFAAISQNGDLGLDLAEDIARLELSLLIYLAIKYPAPTLPTAA